MALKHNGQCLTHKERNKQEHALNRNTMMQATCIALAVTGLMFLMRRNRTVVVQPLYDDHGVISRS